MVTVDEGWQGYDCDSGDWHLGLVCDLRDDGQTDLILQKTCYGLCETIIMLFFSITKLFQLAVTSLQFVKLLYIRALLLRYLHLF